MLTESIYKDVHSSSEEFLMMNNAHINALVHANRARRLLYRKPHRVHS